MRAALVQAESRTTSQSPGRRRTKVCSVACMSTPGSAAVGDRLTYLNDHLAGAKTALEILDHLIATATDDHRPFLTGIKEEISQDRDTLQRLLERLGGHQSAVRQIGGWIAGQAGRLKLLLDDPSRGALEHFEALELLTIGIHGKRLLWRALGHSNIQEFRDIDFVALEQRATDQHDRVDAARLAASRRVIADVS